MVKRTDCGFRIAECGLGKAEDRTQDSELRIKTIHSVSCVLSSDSSLFIPHSAIRNPQSSEFGSWLRRLLDHIPIDLILSVFGLRGLLLDGLRVDALIHGN